MNQAGVNIRVTNRNPWPIPERWDGIPIEFPSGKTVTVELDAAAHFFGFPLDEHGNVAALTPDRDYIIRRYGWNLPTFGIPPSPEGKQVLNPDRALKNAQIAYENLEIQTVEFELVEKAREPDDMPAPRKHAGSTRKAPVALTAEETQRQAEIKAARMVNLAKAREAKSKAKQAAEEPPEPVDDPAGEAGE